MPIVELPNGTSLEFPDGMSQPDMAAAIQRNFPEYAKPQDGPGLISRAGDAISDVASSAGNWLESKVQGLLPTPIADRAPEAAPVAPQSSEDARLGMYESRAKAAAAPAAIASSFASNKDAAVRGLIKENRLAPEDAAVVYDQMVEEGKPLEQSRMLETGSKIAPPKESTDYVMVGLENAASALKIPVTLGLGEINTFARTSAALAKLVGADYLADKAEQLKTQTSLEPYKATLGEATLVDRVSYGLGSALGMIAESMFTPGAQAAEVAKTVSQSLGQTFGHVFRAAIIPGLTDAAESIEKVYAQTGDKTAAFNAGVAKFGGTMTVFAAPVAMRGGKLLNTVSGAAIQPVMMEGSKTVSNLGLPDALKEDVDIRNAYTPETVATGALFGRAMGHGKEADIGAYNKFAKDSYNPYDPEVLSQVKAAATEKASTLDWIIQNKDRNVEAMKLTDTPEKLAALTAERDFLVKSVEAPEPLLRRMGIMPPEPPKPEEIAAKVTAPEVTDVETAIAVANEAPNAVKIATSVEPKTPAAEMMAIRPIDTNLPKVEEAPTLETRASIKEPEVQQNEQGKQDLITALTGSKDLDLNAPGGPTFRGDPVTVLREADLPDSRTGDVGQEFTRGEYEALSTILGVDGKDVVVYAAGKNMPRGLVRSSRLPNTIFLSSEQVAPVAVAFHELDHLMRNSPLHDAYVETIKANLTPGAMDVARLRHGSHLNETQLLAEMAADIHGDARTRADFNEKMLNRLSFKLGGEKATSEATTFLGKLRDMITKVREVVRQKSWNTGDGKAIAEKYVSNLEAVHDALAEAVADRYYRQGKTGEGDAVSDLQFAPKDERFKDQNLPGRWPTSKKLSPSVHDEMLSDLETLKLNPEQHEKAVQALMEEPGNHSADMVSGTLHDRTEHIINRMVSNLLWLHDKVPEAVRERSKLWYDGARKIAETWAEKYNISNSQAAGSLAVLSPQKDWFMNVTMAERVMDIVHTKMDHTFDKRMEAAAFSMLTKSVKNADALEGEAKAIEIVNAKRNIAAYEAVKGKTFREVAEKGDLREMSVWIRAYDEAYHDAKHAIVTPEGGFVENKTTIKGDPTMRAWGDFTTPGKAASIYLDGTPENINAMLGGEHKVRNFYNNIYSPSDPRYTTVDTHAVAADQLRPLAGADKPVADNFGKTGGTNTTGLSGTYALHHEAYNRAAAERGLLPREMQSITWEAVRGLFTEGYKGNKDNVAYVDNIWRQVDEGKLSVEKARDMILEHAKGIEHPDWWNEGNAEYKAVLRDKTYVQERPPFSGAKVTFEVAPDPRNKELKARWDALAPEIKQEISNKVAWKIAAKGLASFGDENMKGELHTQLGGWLADTNPSLSIWFNKRAAATKINEFARMMGYALNQMGMMRTSPRPFDTGRLDPATGKKIKSQEFGSIVIKLPEGFTDAQIHELYTELRSILLPNKKPAINGHSTADGFMAILNDGKKISNEALAQRVGDRLFGRHEVWLDKMHADFPEKGRDSYGIRSTKTSAGRVRQDGAESSLRARSDQLRLEAGVLLDQLIGEHERGKPELQESPREDRERIEPGSPRLSSDEVGVGGTGDKAPRVVYGRRREHSVQLEGFHYSPAKRGVLDSSYYGRGMPGQERRRLDMWSATEEQKPRIHFYINEGNGITPEVGVGGHGHAVDLQNLYNATQDPLGLRKLSQEQYPSSHDDRANALEQLVMKNGFDGYYVPNAQAHQGVAVLLGKHKVPVDYLGTGKIESSIQYSPRETLQAATDKIAKYLKTPKDMLREIKIATVPMAEGNVQAQKTAKEFAIAERRGRWQWNQFDHILMRDFSEADRKRMWEAADEENDIQSGRLKAGKDVGLASLDTKQREVVDLFHQYGQALWQRAIDAGMVTGETSVKFWAPRQAVLIGEDGEIARIPSKGAGATSDVGRNVSTNSPNLKHRKGDTTADTEALGKAAHGEGFTVIRDIRMMPFAMARLEKAIAGRELINQIKANGRATGEELVATGKDGDKGYFTIDHPAFKEWRVTGEDWVPVSERELLDKNYQVRDGKVVRPDPNTVNGYLPVKGYRVADESLIEPAMQKNGQYPLGAIEKKIPQMEKTPIYIRKDWDGPLKAVMSEASGSTYEFLMAAKSKSMGLIMYSPLIHNMVEWGRALPAMDAKGKLTLGLYTYVTGNRAKNDPLQMREAINNGLVPIGGRGQMMDITGMAEAPTLEPGRSLTAKVLAAPVSLISERGAVNVKKAVDAAGKFWHETLLWDRVADLQMGLYTSMKTSLLNKGLAEKDAGLVAAHFANRFAGALPKESMSQAATKILNVAMFSRTFTMGNLGVMKDMIAGLPKDVQAQIKLGSGDVALKAAQSEARRIGIGAFAIDIAMFFIVNSLVQDWLKGEFENGFDGWLGKYKERAGTLAEKLDADPIGVLRQPFNSLESLTSTSENEPGKEGRIAWGEDKDGTMIYMRLPTGKIGEEFANYTKPDTLIKQAKNKLSTHIKPLTELWFNEDFAGRKIFEDTKDANTLVQVSDMVKHFLKAQVPSREIMAAYDLAQGKGDEVDMKKLIGPLMGMTFSTGAPGGPEVGEMLAAERDYKDRVARVMPEVKRAIKYGETDVAEALLDGAGMPAREMSKLLNRLESPTGVTTSMTKRFNKHATEEQRDRLH